MALQFVKQPDGDAGHVIATARLCRTEDDRLVPDSDPDARWLYCTPGTAIPRAEAERYGLLGAKADYKVDDDEPQAQPGEDTPEGPAAKRSRRPADKSRRPAADKTGE